MTNFKFTCPVCGSHDCIRVDKGEKCFCRKCHKKAYAEEFVTDFEFSSHWRDRKVEH